MNQETAPAKPDIQILPVRADHWPEWAAMYRGYIEYFGGTASDELLRTSFDQILDPSHILECVAAELNGKAIGILLYYEKPLPWRAGKSCWLEDLYVDPTVRGLKVGERLMQHVIDMEAERGWYKTEWITEDNNFRGRAIYERIAEKRTWNFYEHRHGKAPPKFPYIG